MKYPIPQSAKETKRLNSKNEFGCIIASTKTSLLQNGKDSTFLHNDTPPTIIKE